MQGGLDADPMQALEPVRDGATPSVDQLCAIWSRVLQVSAVSPDDDFFDLGGDSLLAVTLMLEIERETGCSVPFTAIYDAPSVAALVELMGADENASSGPFVCLKPGDASLPFYLVHGIDGTVMEFASLGRTLQYGGALIGIQASGLDGKKPVRNSVEAMADAYLEAIVAHQPSGPYLIGGYSFGGLVALEICRRLRAQRKEIGVLVMIDSYGHPATWPRLTRLDVRWRRFLRRKEELANCSWSDAMHYAKDKAGQLSFGMLQAARGRNVRCASVDAVYNYRPSRYDGAAFYFRAETPYPNFPTHPQRVWRHVIGELNVQTVAGDHFSVVGEHVNGLEECLTHILNRANAPAPTTSPASRKYRISCDAVRLEESLC
jgi:acetoacetyl-CoA synthetase